jgi:hypothetical protein
MIGGILTSLNVTPLWEKYFGPYFCLAENGIATVGQKWQKFSTPFLSVSMHLDSRQKLSKNYQKLFPLGWG